MWQGFFLYSGKVFFFIVVTCGIGGYGVIKYGIKVKEEKLNAEGITAIFALLSLVGMIGVTTIFMLSAPRIDTILYGRYFNFTIPPMIVAGMYYLYVNKPKLRGLAIVVAVTLISAIGIKGFLDSRSTFQYLQSVGVSIFYDYATDKFDLISSTLLAVEMAVFLWVCSRIKNNKAWIGIIVVIVGLWGYNSHVALYN